MLRMKAAYQVVVSLSSGNLTCILLKILDCIEREKPGSMKGSPLHFVRFLLYLHSS